MTLLLQIEHLSHYFGGLLAVSDFNLELHEGELVGLIGPNGAGKTTVFNLVTGAYRASEGKIIFKFVSHSAAIRVRMLRCTPARKSRCIRRTMSM